MECVLDPTEPSPAASNSNDLRAKRWHEIRTLVTRGVNHPESLTPDEVRRVSSVALIGMRDVGSDWGDARNAFMPTNDRE